MKLKDCLKKVIVLALTWSASLAHVVAQEDRPIGANLTDLSPFGTLWVYTNSLKQSSGWLVQNANDPSDQINGSSELTAELNEAFNSDGYPLEVPFQFNHPDTQGKSLQVSALVLNGQPDPYFYPEGEYLLIFEGEGTLAIQGDVDGEYMEFNTAGEYAIPISNPTSLGIELVLLSSSASDPISNVQLIFPAYVDTYQTEKFRSDFIQLASNFDVLRFMKPLRVEHNTVERWEDRPRSTFFSYYLDVEDQVLIGMPWEEIVAFANLTGIDPWVCVPHMADDNYMANLAQLFHGEMDENRTLYLEYSNETWNPSYPQKWQYMLEQGNARNLGTSTNAELAEQQSIHRFGTLRSLELFEIFNEVYDDDNRVHTILGTQSDPFVADLIFEALSLTAVNPANLMPEAIAIASYIGVTMFDDFESQGLNVCDHTAQDLLDTLIARVTPEMTAFLQRYSELTNETGIDLFAYEGGQHVTEINFQPMVPCAETLVAEMNRLEGMEDFFCSLMDTWYGDLDGELFMIFNLAERPDAFGAFGLLESQWQGTSESNKWTGVSRCALEDQTTLSVAPQSLSSDVIAYPNPSQGQLTISGGLEGDWQFRLVNGLGKEFFRSESNQEVAHIDLSKYGLSQGIYYLFVSSDGKEKSIKIIFN